MATLYADQFSEILRTGSWGNANKHHAAKTLAAAQIADELVLCEVPAGTKLHDLRAVIAALGATTTMSFGWRYKGGEAGGGAAALEAAAPTASASNVRGTFVPVTFVYDAYITATVGGAAATGQVDAVLDYEYKGNL